MSTARRWDRDMRTAFEPKPTCSKGRFKPRVYPEELFANKENNLDSFYADETRPHTMISTCAFRPCWCNMWHLDGVTAGQQQALWMVWHRCNWTCITVVIELPLVFRSLKCLSFPPTIVASTSGCGTSPTFVLHSSQPPLVVPKWAHYSFAVTTHLGTGTAVVIVTHHGHCTICELMVLKNLFNKDGRFLQLRVSYGRYVGLSRALQ